MKVTVTQIRKDDRKVTRTVRSDSKKQAAIVIKQLKQCEIAPHLQQYEYIVERTN